MPKYAVTVRLMKNASTLVEVEAGDREEAAEKAEVLANKIPLDDFDWDKPELDYIDPYGDVELVNDDA